MNWAAEHLTFYIKFSKFYASLLYSLNLYVIYILYNTL